MTIIKRALVVSLVWLATARGTKINPQMRGIAIVAEMA
jgi:hypothetical protein